MNGALCRLAATVGRTLSRGRNALPSTGPVRMPFSVRAPSSAHRSVAAPVHLDTENFNMHNMMANDPTYDGTIVRLDAKQCWPVVTDRQFYELVAQDFDAKTATEVCDDFLRVSVYASGKEFCLLDTMFDGLRNRLIAVLPTATDHELMSVFRLIRLWNVNNAKDPVFFKLWSAFDKQCIERYKTWSLNKLLLCMDHWYIMRLSRLSNFVWLGLRKMARKPSRLTPKQLVQMMFYANTSRKYLPTLPMYDIEQEICNYYNDFNIKELSIVSLGFFKTQTPIRNQELVRNMHISVINEIANIKSFEMAAFLKIFRYCTKYQNAEFMYKLMDGLTEKVDDVQLLCCTHMAILGTNLLIKHEDLLKKISQRIVNEISQTRIKDLERLTLALTMLNYNPKTIPCIFETIINELRSDTRQIEFEEYPRSYIFTLSYLAVNNIFPYDCISKALTNFQKKIGKKLSRFTVPRDILCLNNSLLIECNDYTGTLLPETLRNSCNEHLAWHTPNLSNLAVESATDKNFMKIYRELLNVFKNESYFHVCYPLPHHPKCDILFCIDSNSQPVIIPETMKNKTSFNDFQKPPKLGKWFAIMILSRNSVLYSSKEYTGLTLCKIRQLKKLDYDPIVITFEELNNCGNIQHLIFNKFKIHGVVLKYN